MSAPLELTLQSFLKMEQTKVVVNVQIRKKIMVSPKNVFNMSFGAKLAKTLMDLPEC